MLFAYEGTILLQTLYLIFYSVDYVFTSSPLARIAHYIHTVTTFLVFIFLAIQTAMNGALPIFNSVDALLVYYWLFLLVALVMKLYFKMDSTVFLVNVFAFIVLLLHLFLRQGSGDGVYAGLESSPILLFHVLLAITSYVSFGIGFVFSVVYYAQVYLLKRKKTGKWFRKFESLLRLEQFAFYSVCIGLPLLTLSITIGMIAVMMQIHPVQWHDSKIIGSLTVLFSYTIYFYLRSSGVRGIVICYWNMLSFGVVVINYFLFNSLSAFHLWYY